MTTGDVYGTRIKQRYWRWRGVARARVEGATIRRALADRWNTQKGGWVGGWVERKRTHARTHARAHARTQALIGKGSEPGSRARKGEYYGADVRHLQAECACAVRM